MALRFCHRCASEVEDAGGFCLLGHPLRLEPPIPSVSHIRDEVDRAFVEARIEAAEPAPTEPEPQQLCGAPGQEPQPEPVPAPVSRAEPPPALESDPLDTATPPPPPLGTRRRPTVWESLDEDEAPDASDPIAAFAPAGRMDWGPDRNGVLPLVLRRREDPATA